MGFDVGNFMMGMIGRFIAGEGKQPISFDLCQSRDDCEGQAPMPEPR